MPALADCLERAIDIARQHGATRLVLFGSALDAPARTRDLDLAVEGVSGWDFFGLVADLEAHLPVPVDVVPLDQVRENWFTASIRERGRVIFERDTADALEADDA
ncbi:MAG: DNA polymerase III subunit beta [Bacteroidetes bacterium]|jgi:predicted nucleotidyltransferase|nr:DNA polymerase III subunit beta [Bacteroidota bacterium]